MSLKRLLLFAHPGIEICAKKDIDIYVDIFILYRIYIYVLNNLMIYIYIL